MAETDLTLPGLADRDFLPREYLGTSGLLKTDRMSHSVSPVFSGEDGTLPHSGESFEQSLRFGDGQRTYRPLADIGGWFAIDETLAESRVVAWQRGSGGEIDNHPIWQG